MDLPDWRLRCVCSCPPKKFEIRCLFEQSFADEIKPKHSLIHFHTRFLLGTVAGIAAPRDLEIPLGFQQSPIILLAPHRDETKQGWDVITPPGPYTTSSLLFRGRIQPGPQPVDIFGGTQWLQLVLVPYNYTCFWNFGRQLPGCRPSGCGHVTSRGYLANFSWHILVTWPNQRNLFIRRNGATFRALRISQLRTLSRSVPP